MGVDENKHTLEEFDRLLGAEDLSALDRLCLPDMVNHALAPDRPAGLAGTREFLETMGRHQMTHEGWSSSSLSPRVTTSCGTAPDMAAGTVGGSWVSRQTLATTTGRSLLCTASWAIASRSVGPYGTT
jgi:hypothetical protein